jgi:hypothetical protein
MDIRLLAVIHKQAILFSVRLRACKAYRLVRHCRKLAMQMGLFNGKQNNHYKMKFS